MTYCLAITLDDGLVFASDSRTNAGADQVSMYSKMHTFELEKERVFVLLTAGNLATSQAVLSRIKRDIEDEAEESLHSVRGLSDAAAYLGRINREEREKHDETLTKAGFSADASFILGGQIGRQTPEIYLVYPQGNFITTSSHTRFLQIGESKYGKPILDRIIARETPLGDAARCALVSIDSTMRSNVTVGPPIEMIVYERDALTFEHYLCLDADDEYLMDLKRAWDDNIRHAFQDLPRFDWEASRRSRHRGSQLTTTGKPGKKPGKKS
ncbi:peptidase [Ectothiorhodospira lacustris]|uniref:peptidase n=1 Tax=Ectothiorhodospira lacustris TaxID=2899127 RepID=UPI001EE96CEC|nr:peptidase [Ectothiorhodospira lacustris]MCG5500019.1 peptidase [Ectothiorhodospira lacustris]MCG5510063.1 peptidase [Ectothiorhodospira lacustris]MCG5521809.1 peptidase [Ectothiorhodospira lacustris]